MNRKAKILTTGILALLVWTVDTGKSQSAIIGPYSATVNFDSATDLNDFTSLGSTGSVRPVSYNAAAGSNGVAGRLQLDSPYNAGTAGQRVVYYTPSAASNGLIQMPAGEVLSMSADFLVSDANSGAVPRIGLHENNTDQFGDNTGWNHFMVLPRGSSQKTLTVRTFDAGAVTQDEGAIDISLTNGLWYRMSFDLTKSLTPDTFSYDATLASLDSSGNVASILRTEDGSFTNSTLYDDGFYGYLNFQAITTGSFVGTTDYDNFQLNITGDPAPVPEPSTAILLLSAMLGFSILRKRQRTC